MRRFVLDLQDRRPIWSMPSWVAGRIRSALGDGWEVVEIQDPSDGSGDGAGQARPAVLEALEGAEVYAGYGIPDAVLEHGRSLRWVHSGAAGVGGSLRGRLLTSDVVFTNSAGVHAVPMAETVLAMLLHFARGLDLAAAGKRERRWAAEDFYAAEAPLRELGGSTVLVVGFGGIGQEVARRLLAFGSRVVAVRRRALPSPVAGVEVRTGTDGLREGLREADFVVLCAPGTSETAGLIGAAELALLPAHAVLVNVARGPLVDEEALAEALRSGRLRGAGLDVFRKEPLHAASPLWDLPNALLTPHVSAVTRGFWERQTALIEANIGHYLASGAPEVNVVDKRAGY